MKLHFVHADDGVVDVRAEGPLAPDDPQNFADSLVELCGPEVYGRQVRLDMAETDFISSAGIGGLLHCHKMFAESGGSLVVRSPSRTVRQTLDLLRLEKVLKID
ncbi:MAG: STAS domain-containing protein [Pirellulales bacterium]